MDWFAEILFWACLSAVIYTYFGYAFIIYILSGYKKKKISLPDVYEPAVTMVIPSFNEFDVLERKVSNCLELEYPEEKLDIIFITDGSTDGSKEFLEKYNRLKLLHLDKRAGKSMAENRAMQFVKTPITIFCDANTILNKEAIRNMVRHFSDENTGAVSGEKKIISLEKDSASSAEGFYWRYESWLKKLDSVYYTVVGAAGELFAIRSELFSEMQADTINDDLTQSMQVAIKGFKVAYEPGAYALESASDNINEELKRKKRMVAGAWQAMLRLPKAFNPFHDARLTFQFLSHRVFRWTICPLALILLIPLNVMLYIDMGGIYTLLLVGQSVFYLLAILGWMLEHKRLRFRIMFIPFYFIFMNVAAVLGFSRFVKGGQSPMWERAQRKVA